MKARICRYLATGLLLCASLSHAASWEDEQWIAEPFTQALGGGPTTGPIMESGASVDSLCADAQGNRYLARGQIIDIATPDGLRRHLAGSGKSGYRDGPAHQARFRLGFGAYYGAYNIACSPQGNIFVADSGNRRVRRIFSKDGSWHVDTWAGGGNVQLQKGKSTRATAVSLRGTLSVAVTPQNEVVVATDYGVYRISSDGKTITYLDTWPKSTARKPDKRPRLNIMMGDADRHGNTYFVSRTPDVVVKISPEGAVSHLAGIVIKRGRKPHHIGDGPPLEAYFDTPNSLVADPGGSAVYVCGGDEYDIRRVPTDGISHTATLMQNGRWYHASVHPNRSRGAAVIEPKARGRLKPDGKLTDLMVSPLVGRDAAGNLYGKLVPWKGMTQYVNNQGLLPTKVFRLRRVIKEKKP